MNKEGFSTSAWESYYSVGVWGANVVLGKPPSSWEVEEEEDMLGGCLGSTPTIPQGYSLLQTGKTLSDGTEINCTIDKEYKMFQP